MASPDAGRYSESVSHNRSRHRYSRRSTTKSIDHMASITLPAKKSRLYRRFGKVEVCILDPALWAIGKLARYLSTAFMISNRSEDYQRQVEANGETVGNRLGHEPLHPAARERSASKSRVFWINMPPKSGGFRRIRRSLTGCLPTPLKRHAKGRNVSPSFPLRRLRTSPDPRQFRRWLCEDRGRYEVEDARV